MSEIQEKPKLSHAYKKGDLVVFKHIVWTNNDDSGFYSDYLHEVTKVHRRNDYLEIRETKCWHCNRRVWGSDGSDIRPANQDEIIARSRLPKIISGCAKNPHSEVVFHIGRSDILRIEHYTDKNSLLLKDKDGLEIEVEIFDIREASIKERLAGCRDDLEQLA